MGEGGQGLNATVVTVRTSNIQFTAANVGVCYTGCLYYVLLQNILF